MSPGDSTVRVEELDGVPIDHRNVVTNGVRLHVAQAGPEDGDPVILLHGFPEFWYGWRHQIPALADAGYRVWAPDQRGYNTSETPPGVAPYRLAELVADVAGLADETGRDRVPVVAHDWGAIVGWQLATTRPERVERLVAINVPHPAVFARALPGDLRQLAKSWYVYFFQLPRVPELLASLDDWRGGVSALRSSSRPGTFTDEDIRRYKAAWSRPGTATAMINWYRALVRLPPELPDEPRVEPPTLLLWGANDTALRRTLARPSVDRCADGRLVFFEDATHWVQHEEPDHVNEYVTDFLAGREVE